jgi:hypothetical protein
MINRLLQQKCPNASKEAVVAESRDLSKKQRATLHQLKKLHLTENQRPNLSVLMDTKEYAAVVAEVRVCRPNEKLRFDSMAVMHLHCVKTRCTNGRRLSTIWMGKE